MHVNRVRYARAAPVAGAAALFRKFAHIARPRLSEIESFVGTAARCNTDLRAYPSRLSVCHGRLLAQPGEIGLVERLALKEQPGAAFQRVALGPQQVDRAPERGIDNVL